LYLNSARVYPEFFYLVKEPGLSKKGNKTTKSEHVLNTHIRTPDFPAEAASDEREE
jgi:hypothetical protein